MKLPRLIIPIRTARRVAPSRGRELKLVQAIPAIPHLPGRPLAGA